MTEESAAKRIAEQFILDEIDSVPHLEALLLIWNSRPVSWSAEQMAQRLFVHPDAADRILQDLTRKNLIGLEAGTDRRYAYVSTADRDQLMASVDETYRRDLVRLSRAIHAKGSPALQDFLRAFRLKKE
jgi:hypothetical protein